MNKINFVLDLKYKIVNFLLSPFINFFKKYGLNEVTVTGIFVIIVLLLLIRQELKNNKSDKVFIVILILGICFMLIAIIKYFRHS
jgi:uncharacterized membrane protein